MFIVSERKIKKTRDIFSFLTMWGEAMWQQAIWLHSYHLHCHIECAVTCWVRYIIILWFPSCSLVLISMIITNCCGQEQVFARIKALVTKPEALRTGISASDASMTLGIAPAMAKEHLLTAESRGIMLCCFLRILVSFRI